MRNRHVVLDPALRLNDRRTEITVADAVFQRNEALAVLAVDIRRAADELDVAQIAEPDIGGRRLRIRIRQRHGNRADGFEIPAEFRCQTYRQRKNHLAFIDFGDFLTADRSLDHGIDVTHQEAVARGLGAIDPNNQIGLTEQIETGGIGDAADLGEFGFHRFGQPLQFDQVLAEDLDRVLAFDAGDGFLNIVLDVLREIEVDADEFAVEPLAHLLDHLLLVQSGRPLVERLQRNEELGEKRTVGIGAFIAAPLLGEYGLNWGIAGDHGADFGHRLHPGLKRYGRWHHRTDPKIALFQLGQEFGAEPQRETEAKHQKHCGSGRRAAMIKDGAHQNGLVELADLTDHEGFDFLDMRRQQDRGQHRRHGEGCDYGAEQCISIGTRHRAEDLTFHALHREQRQEGRDRDNH